MSRDKKEVRKVLGVCFSYFWRIYENISGFLFYMFNMTGGRAGYTLLIHFKYIFQFYMKTNDTLIRHLLLDDINDTLLIFITFYH